MKILYIAPFYHPTVGGVEEVARRVAEYTVSKGNEVFVATYNRLRNGGEGSLLKEETVNDVHIVRLKPNIIWSHGTYSTELPELLRRLRPDLVHVHVWRHPHVFQVAKLKERLRFKAVLHTHAPFHMLNQLGVIIWFYYGVVDRLMKNAVGKYDLLIALTSHERSILVGKLGVQQDKVIIIPNGIDDRIFDLARKTAKTDTMVFYLGRICKQKNVDLLVKAMKHVKKEVLNARLVMAGPDEGLAVKLRDYGRKRDVNFQYLGMVSENEKFELYRKCSVFAHPAFYEPFGITLLEAQAFGNPCVITGEGGQTYAAPPKRTSLHAKPNPKDFGEAISLLLNNKELYEKLSFNAREWASRHLWSRILPKYYEVYRRIVSNYSIRNN